MHKRIGKLFVMIFIFALALNPVNLTVRGDFKAAARAADDKAEKLTCSEVNVKEYSLNALIESIYVECGKKLMVAEPLPTTKVALAMTGGVPTGNSLLAGKFGLVFQPVPRKAGDFQAGGGYTSGGAADADTWNVCLVDGSSQAAGKIRLYEDKGNYRLTASAASVKNVIKRVESLFGDRFPNFATNVTRQLFVLGVDLSDKDVDVKVSLKEAISDFNKFESKLVELVYKAHLAASDDLGPDIWPLTFVQPSVGSAKTANDGIDALVAALNTLYPQQAQVQRSRNNLLIYGASDKRLAIRRLLALVDVPSPQVQMDMWTIQVSGKPDQIAQKIELIKKDINLTRAAMTAAQTKLNDKLRKDKEKGKLVAEEINPLRELGFDREVDDALSLNEALILLSCYKDEQEAGEAVNELGNDINSLEKDLSQEMERNSNPYLNTFPEKQRAVLAQRLKMEPRKLGLPRLKKLYGSKTGSKKAIGRLANAMRNFKNGDTQGPDRLRQEAAIVDRLLKATMDAYATDMQELFLDPLLRRIEALNGGLSRPQKAKDEGVTVNGRVRMVVSSSLPSTLDATMASYANITRPEPLSLQTLLDSGLPRSENFPIKSSGQPSPTPTPATSVETEALSGAARVFGSLSPFPAVLLAGALSAEPAPTFREVSPGISLKIQPTVLPDNGSARIAVEAEFKVDTSVFGNQENPWVQPPADAVKRHKVETDAIVNVFDLFDISSFSLESSYPQAPFYIPVLGRLPVVGPAFQFPRDKKRTHHESIILVNAVILPRALDLARYYGN